MAPVVSNSSERAIDIGLTELRHPHHLNHHQYPHDHQVRPNSEETCEEPCPGHCVVGQWSSWSACKDVRMLIIFHSSVVIGSICFFYCSG